MIHFFERVGVPNGINKSISPFLLKNFFFSKAHNRLKKQFEDSHKCIQYLKLVKGFQFSEIYGSFAKFSEIYKRDYRFFKLYETYEKFINFRNLNIFKAGRNF